jgi:hypothetical protein
MTVDEIGVVFGILRGGGSKMPYKNDDQLLEAMRVWAQLLAGVDPGSLAEAAVQYMLTGKSHFWPSTGELYALLPTAPEAIDADGRWGEVMELVSRYGHYTPPKSPGATTDPDNPDDWTVDEPTWRGISACGGWRTLCATPRDSMAPQRAAFRSAYSSALGRERRQLRQHAARALLTETPQLKVGE